MVNISVGYRTLHLYRGEFLWDNSSPVPSSFITMGSRRRSRGNRRRSSYLPVVVLNSQQPYMESRSETINRNQVQNYKKSTSWPGKFSINDLTFGVLGSSSNTDPMMSSSSQSGGYSGGGCSSAANTLLLLTALAVSAFILNQAIIMNIGRKKRRFAQDSQMTFIDAGMGSL
jgi:hypothetical protein